MWIIIIIYYYTESFSVLEVNFSWFWATVFIAFKDVFVPFIFSLIDLSEILGKETDPSEEEAMNILTTRITDDDDDDINIHVTFIKFCGVIVTK